MKVEIRFSKNAYSVRTDAIQISNTLDAIEAAVVTSGDLLLSIAETIAMMVK